MKYRKYSTISLFVSVLLLAIGFIGGLITLLTSTDSTFSMSLITAIACVVSGLISFALFFLISGILEGIADIIEKLQNQDNIDY